MRKVAEIYLIRHAKSLANIDHLYGTNLPLCEEGIAQAKESAIRLQEAINPDIVFASTKQRAIQTAKLLFGDSSVVATLPQFDEIHFGKLEGLPIGDKANSPIAKEPSWLKQKYDGDDILERADATLEAMENMAKLFVGQRIAVITHDTLMQGICACMNHGELEGHIWTGEYTFPNLGYCALHIAL